MNYGWILRGLLIWICSLDSEWTLRDSGWILDLDMLGVFWVDSVWILEWIVELILWLISEMESGMEFVMESRM